MGEDEFQNWVERVARAYEAIDTSSYYDLLGIPRNAPQDAIRQAFHKRATQLHPDRHRSTPEPARSRVYALFKRVAEGYRVLMDHELRQAYDEGLEVGVLRLVDERSVRRGSREDQLRTPAGTRHYRAAAEALGRGDLQTAILNIELAISHEGNAPLLNEMLAGARKAAREKH